jgi:ssDNA-binding replication factor A large subunit
LATLEGTVVALEPVREVMVPGGVQKRVRTARLKDATGEIALTLWGEEVEMVQEGDRVRIQEGWVKDYKGRPQLSLGRLGRLTKLDP